MAEQPTAEEQWRALLTGQHPALRRGRRVNKLLPSNPRCRFCNAPFSGFGGVVMRAFQRKSRSRGNPNFCNMCDQFARTCPGGAEIELTLLFADVRGSTALAERMSPSAFSRLMSRFYGVATEVLVRSDAYVDKIVGDEVVAQYFPGFAGPDHAHLAVHAAQELLVATGHARPEGPWLPVGAGVHLGTAYVGVVASKDVIEITALGDAVNTAARLASQAGPGEVLVSEAACAAAALAGEGLEHRRLALKGRSEPVDVRVLRVGVGAAGTAPA
ncbi:MAG: adenylate/guanylate cyclase domain-containing protein [Chloroflexi bacterium]|nr:adenylate/guanylate cyclase domain-containing protein [Chloroflexota bacterium]